MASAETSAAPFAPHPAVIPSQNVPQAPSGTPALQALETSWVEETLLPFLHYACIDLGLSASQLKDSVLAAKIWAFHRQNPPTVNEDILFERIFMFVMNRHNSTDIEIAPYAELTPLVRYLVRRAMINGPYKLLDRKWTGSKEWVAEMAARYKCTCKACGSKEKMLSTEEMMGRELLE
ncbi:uncharacterized protein N0V89_007245 [Didymosphaeria variabile]|uniref:Uncharacterized protein n=1 Tax=Didymosphaeria variabile TaxID=1932322 RepID=A0A9W8XJQ8_9PLEO|nr:uncharacterized protein N0V89_007245 [Didymosphaeria variabile]KAJ4351901.1 hypothetical protein N0V89_007245 [Didymosphaeria variabile]